MKQRIPAFAGMTEKVAHRVNLKKERIMRKTICLSDFAVSSLAIRASLKSCMFWMKEKYTSDFPKPREKRQGFWLKNSAIPSAS
jgi:hypothetical protein